MYCIVTYTIDCQNVSEVYAKVIQVKNTLQLNKFQTNDFY